MATIGDENGRKRILFTAGDGKRKTLRIGEASQKQAADVLRHVEALIRAQNTGNLDTVTEAWLSERPDVMLDKLAAVGLIQPRKTGGVTIGAFIDQFLSSRPDFKPLTVTNFKQLRKKLVGVFGETRDMRTISAGDAEAFRIHLVKAKLGENSIRRFIGRSRQLFKAAIRQEIYRGNNPFDGMAAAVGADKSREYFVTREMIDKVMEKCPDAQWKLMVALSRYGGLRCPSEHLALTWGDVDWEHNRIRVRSPKTEHHAGKDCRIIPLFPELRPYLMAALEETGYGAAGGEPVITRYRDPSCNLRTHFVRIIEKAGLNKWPKLWHNMRASRQTELAEQFPIHVVCEWIGNSRAIAQKHYLQVTDAYFERAVSAARNPAQSGAESGGTEKNAKDRKSGIPANSAPLPLVSVGEYPQQGSNLRPPV